MKKGRHSSSSSSSSSGLRASSPTNSTSSKSSVSGSSSSSNVTSFASFGVTLPWRYCLGVAFLGGLVYINALDAGFAYDDSRAIEGNQDVRPSTPLSSLFQNDFWGTSLTHSGSHKSYRPLCVLSFRLNFLLHQLHPWGYHFVNVILHSLVCLLFTRLAGHVFQGDRRPALISSLMFASHPIHTEAVTSVVGRADVGAGLFFLLSFTSYLSFVKNFNQHQSRLYLWSCLTFATMSMLTKETGITVLAVCGIYHLLIHHKVLPTSRNSLMSVLREKRFSCLREGLLHLSTAAVILLSTRFLLMGLKTPDFASADNPAANSGEFMTRTLTFLFLPVFNFYLMLYPKQLSFDWSMESIPLITSLFDTRNVLTIIFYSLLIILCKRLVRNRVMSHSGRKKTPSISSSSYCASCAWHSSFLQHKGVKHNKQLHLKNLNNNNSIQINNNIVCTCPSRDLLLFKSYTLNKFLDRDDCESQVASSSEDATLLSVILMVIPFLPASNLFFYVGFVVAERVLYIPSMGFCLLMAKGMEVLAKRKTSRFITTTTLIGLSILLTSYSIRTFVRNIDWKNEENLYSSGIAINPPKAYGNLGNILSSQGRKDEAERSYRKALSFRPNMADVHYNLGILLQEQGRLEEALESYGNAIRFRPRLAVAHLNMAIVLTSLGRQEEAIKVYRHCASIDGTGLKDPKGHENTKTSALFNLGRLYSDQGKYKEAIETYKEAIERMPQYYSAHHSLYNMMGEAWSKLGDFNEAEKWFKRAISAKPNHVPAHLTLAKMYAKVNRSQEAEKFFLDAHHLAPNDTSVHQHYGQFLMDMKRFEEASSVYKKGILVSPKDFDLVFNAASALRQGNHNEEAEEYYKLAVRLRPDEVSSHMNLGAMFHVNGKLTEAESEYLEALRIRPDDIATKNNLSKLRSLMQRRMTH